jgi:hypothetical protein
MNRRIGWILVIVGFAWASWLDPWSLGQSDPSSLIDGTRMAVRQAQVVVIGMAFLQLAVAELIAAGPYRRPTKRIAAALTCAGAVTYVSGYAVGVVWPPAAWLVPAGALLNLAGFLVLCGTREAWTIPSVFAFGMLLDVASGLLVVEPAQFRPAFLGPDDGVRLRMLRLARAAAIALPVLVVLSQRFVGSKAGDRARGSLLAGAVGMPAVLAAACFTLVSLKYLLPLTALATFAGTVAAARQADHRASALERGGWWLVAASMGVGLFMGLYAFDGPLPTPGALGPYLALTRRLSRLGHGYAIVLGLLAIFLARKAGDPRTGRLGAGLVVVGGATTLAAIGMVASSVLPTASLACGPALVACGTALALTRSHQGTAG